MPRLPWAKPIKVVLAQEKEQARTMLMDQQIAAEKKASDARAKAVEDAARGRAEEGQLVRASRINASALLKFSAQLLVGLAGKTDKVKALIDDPMTDAVTILALMQRIASLAQQGIMVGEHAMKMERMLLGEPTEIIGFQVSDMSMDMAMQEVQAAVRAANWTKRAGLVFDDDEDHSPVLEGVVGDE